MPMTEQITTPSIAERLQVALRRAEQLGYAVEVPVARPRRQVPYDAIEFISVDAWVADLERLLDALAKEPKSSTRLAWGRDATGELFFESVPEPGGDAA
jgi:hypothetical protein